MCVYIHTRGACVFVSVYVCPCMHACIWLFVCEIVRVCTCMAVLWCCCTRAQYTRSLLWCSTKRNLNIMKRSTKAMEIKIVHVENFSFHTGQKLSTSWTSLQRPSVQKYSEWLLTLPISRPKFDKNQNGDGSITASLEVSCASCGLVFKVLQHTKHICINTHKTVYLHTHA